MLLHAWPASLQLQMKKETYLLCFIKFFYEKILNTSSLKKHFSQVTIKFSSVHLFRDIEKDGDVHVYFRFEISCKAKTCTPMKLFDKR